MLRRKDKQRLQRSKSGMRWPRGLRNSRLLKWTFRIMRIVFPILVIVFRLLAMVES